MASKIVSVSPTNEVWICLEKYFCFIETLRSNFLLKQEKEQVGIRNPALPLHDFGLVFKSLQTARPFER